MKKRMLSLLLAVVLCLSLLPTAALADGTDSSAAGTAAIQLGTGGLRSPTAAETEGGTDYTPNSYVYFGAIDGTPIQWRVLDAGKTSDDSDGVFLLSERVLGRNVPFRDDGSSNKWNGSKAQIWCQFFASAADPANTAFSEAENAVIRETSKEAEPKGFVFGNRGTGIYLQGNALSGDKVFFLSGREAERYLGSYDRAPQLIALDVDGKAAADWWLRSPYPGDQPGDVQAGFIQADGVVTADTVAEGHGTRPALNLDAEKVLFISPAQGSSSNVGLEPVGSYTGNEWKLTLTDEAHSAFTATTTGTNEGGLTFSYQNAQIGKNEYLSAIVTDADGSITHYGRVQSKAISESDSIQSIILPNDFDEKTDKIYVFNEQDNGAYKTNYASSLVELSLTPGSGGDVSITSITAVGNGRGNWLNGAAYSNDTPSNKMEETSPGVYEITYTNIAASGEDDYAVRFVTTGSWTHSWGAAYDEENELLPDVAAYNGDNIYFSVAENNSTVKLVLDLSKFSFETEEGATYSITVTPPGGGTEEPSAAEVTSGGKTTGYPTLKAAFAAVQIGDTVKLLEDVTENSAIALSVDGVAFDLNGHTARDCTLTLEGSAGLTIIDSSEEKTGSFGDVTVNYKGSLILDGVAVGKITADSDFASITLKAGTKFAGYQNPKGMVLAEWIEDGCCVVSDDSGTVSLVNYEVKSQDGPFTVTKAPATVIATQEKSGTIQYNGLMPQEFIPEITAEDASVSSVDMQWYCWSILNDDQLVPIAKVGTIDLKDPSKTTRGAVNSDYIFRALGFGYDDEMLGIFCVLTAKDSGGNELWSTVLHGYTFTLKRADLSDAKVTATDLVYTPGQTQTLAFKVTHISDWTVLHEDWDYKIKDNSNQGENAGKYTLVLEGMGNYEGTLEYEWEVKPCELYGFYPSAKDYDGTTDLPDDICFLYSVPGEPTGRVLLSKKDDKDFTATGGFDDPNAGERNVDVTITLNNKNYTFENGKETKQFTFEEVSIKPAYPPDDPDSVTITVYNNREAVYTYDVSQLLPKLDSGRSYGKITYSAWWNHDNTYVPDDPDNKPTIDSNGVLHLPINAVDSDTKNPKIAFFKITVQSTNYYDFYLRIYVEACNPLTPDGEPTLSKKEITYGDALSTIKLSGTMTGENGETVEGTFEWVNPDETPNAGKAVSAEWKFTPTEPKYVAVNGTTTITVNPAQLTGVVVDQQDELTYNGTAQQASVSASATAVNEQKVTFTYCDTQNGTYSETVPSFINAGEHMVFYKASAPNHEDATGSFKVTINKADPICTAPTGVSAVYGQTLSKITLTNPDGNTPGTWTWADGTQSVGDVGEHPFKAKYTPDDEINYNSEENISVSVTVGKAQPTASAVPTAKDLVYTGEAQALIKPGATADGTMMYSLSKDGDYALTIPTGIDAGKYVVWYKIIGDGNHENSDPASVEVIIARQPVAIPEADTSEFTYNGADHTYTLAENERYTIAGNVKKDTGVYTVTVTLKDTENFVWSDNTDAAKEYTFTIAAAPVTITVKDKRAYVYGTAPDLSKPVLNRDYTVSGLIGSDELTTAPTLTYDPATPNLNKIGEAAAIKASGASAGRNYEIAYVDGKLTVIARPASGGGSSTGTTTKTETTTNPDGSTTKTETKSDGTVTETTTNKDGSTTKTETKPDGSSKTEVKDASGSTGTVNTDKNGQTTAEAKVSDKAVSDAKKADETVKIPAEVTPGEDSASAPTVKIDLPKDAGETKVEIPVKDVTPGTVAIIVKPDGTEEILKDAIPTENGIQLTVEGDVTVKIVDNAKDFTDTKGHWAEESIDFVSARGLVNGTSESTFDPNAPTTRAQLWTILARQDNADLTGGSVWYEKAQAWAKANGISDGTDPNGTITRAQMVTMLWRAAGSPEVSGTAAFTDVSADSYYAKAVAWAVEQGITTGVGGGKFDPNGACTRAQIATFLHRLYLSE